MKINAALRLKADRQFSSFSKELVKISQDYYPHIPLRDIGLAAEHNGLALIDEDGSPWEGILTGREGRCTIELGDYNSHHPTGKQLQVQWYKMPSGKYEINLYVS